MVLLSRALALTAAAIFLCSCQIGYIAESGYHQAKLMRQRVPLKYALENYKLTPEERKRIELAIELRKFMKDDLNLNIESNFSRYVPLDRDSVTYAVNASAKDQLKPYEWNFPIIGRVPYKAYFKKQSAIDESKVLAEKNLDVHVRGVAAYSTLGWFEDPLLSSMLKMKEHDFVNLLIHETVHANLYIKSNSSFNERVASFLGQLGAEAYYKKLNRGDELKKIVADESHDDLLFSNYITAELKKLRTWYTENKTNPALLKEREQQFAMLKKNFAVKVFPQMHTKNYSWFEKIELNNAILLLLELYNSDFSELEKIANANNRDFKKTFAELKKLE